MTSVQDALIALASTSLQKLNSHSFLTNKSKTNTREDSNKEQQKWVKTAILSLTAILQSTTMCPKDLVFYHLQLIQVLQSFTLNSMLRIEEEFNKSVSFFLFLNGSSNTSSYFQKVSSV